MTEKDLFASHQEENPSDFAAAQENSDAQRTVVSEEDSRDGQFSLFEESNLQEDVQISLWDDVSEEQSRLDSFAVSAEREERSETVVEVPELIISSVDESSEGQAASPALSFLEDFDEDSFYTPADQIPHRRRPSVEIEEKISDAEISLEEAKDEELFLEENVAEAADSSLETVFEEPSEVGEVLPDKKKIGKKPGSAVSPVVEFVEIIVGALVAAILVLTLVCRTGVVEGGSMLPTMHNGDRYIISDLFYTPKAGDIVVFRPEIEGEDELWIKRVVAVEGQTVYINPETYRVYVDDQLLDEPYLNGQGTIPHTTPNPITVPEGCVFVLGDNRAISHDSRYEDLGCVEVRQLAGRVILRFWPLESFGFCK